MSTGSLHASGVAKRVDRAEVSLGLTGGLANTSCNLCDGVPYRAGLEIGHLAEAGQYAELSVG